MANSQLPVHLPDVDYDDSDVEDGSTSSQWEDNVFDNPLYEPQLQTGTEVHDEEEKEAAVGQPNDTHDAGDVPDVVQASKPEETVIDERRGEVTVGDVEVMEASETSVESYSNVDNREYESMNDVVSRHNADDVERQHFSLTRKADVAAEARRIRERELTICISMFVVVIIGVVLGLVIFFSVSATKSLSSTTESPITSVQPTECPRIVSRVEWGARTAVETEPLSVPTPYLVIHHTDTSECNNTEDCVNAVRGIQNYHMDTNGWWDIGYNFLLGGDGLVYEGRGWDINGAHAREYNSYSIGLAMIGAYSSKLPTSVIVQRVLNPNPISARRET
ncbi:uncharacterized protein LOC100892590 [Strongylocentrotus purpuratus]|uniref:Peptidoglycan recognition protein family domain-containing protein n=1 Tax=Strongylocentrotus purpuratus TaxID=7668 RepID=A0A7M7PEC7_STRPU|nr:uncharacterized protein LOC100892590 [Strongylocentrotus purpuratus]